eukprot:TRINITY_DN4604_c0_g2_i1.p1 TRINITY_DN4604_c0_g2~~TRINITY_DN4604_c0_g2_i1.p1  ORF type:complete len:965 (+),score=256.92 TRINITY_DN4604_c0_g2_i1:597-3491(+)
MVAPPLPTKEANLFRLVVKAYEAKQYKKGVKAADQILKKFPEHGETLSMKGLLLNAMERKTEAYELVRRGLKFDLKSHVSWHVYGLLYRSDREYREAIKCYCNALRIEPDSIQILRDLSSLQAQMRDRSGFVETRRQLLQLRPSNRNNWIAFALAQHCSGDADTAVKILEAYEGTLEEEVPPDSERYEHSEMLLYKVMVLEESGKVAEALAELDKKEDAIVDKLGLKEQRAAFLLQLHRPAEAERMHRSLLEINPDNYNYYTGLQACLGLLPGEGGTYSQSKVDMLVKLYQGLQKLYPRSAAAKRIPLDFLEGTEFTVAVDAYIRALLRKGVPFLFSDLKPLYQNPQKADILDELLRQMLMSIREHDCFPCPKGEEDSQVREGPATLLWLLVLLAQHYEIRGEVEKALETIDAAIAHTPTVTDLYLVKGRILEGAGDPVAAAALADEARSMDLADRFLNSEAVKQMLRADQVEKAEKTAALFTRDGEQYDNLFDMQCMWYELASGDSHLRKNALGKALKKYTAINKHYNDMVEDQFDFHTYCLRKMTLRAYIKMLRFEDKLHSYPFFCKGAHGAIRCYLALHDNPPKAAAEEEEAALAGLSAADRKKMRQKLRKAEAKAKKEAEEKAAREEEEREREKERLAAAASASKTKKSTAPVRPVDPDPDGAKLAQVEDPLAEAVKFIVLLQEHAAEELETHLDAFEVYFRRKKLLKALQALKRQLRLQPNSPKVHSCRVRFFHLVDGLPAAASEHEQLVHEVIALERGELPGLPGDETSSGSGSTTNGSSTSSSSSSNSTSGNRGLIELNETFLQQNNDSLLHRAVAAEMLALLAPQEKERAVAIVEGSCSPPEPSATGERGGAASGSRSGRWQLEDCLEVWRMLTSDPLNDTAAAQRWQERCADLFPYSVDFKGKLSSAGRPSLPALPSLAGTPNGVATSDWTEEAGEGTTLKGAEGEHKGVANGIA